jgi:hypothetical protein
MIKVITKAAYRCGDLLASPWTILLFALVSLTALPQTFAAAVSHGDITVLVGWFSQNFVQLVSLAVLAFIADRQGRAAQKRGDEMYDWLSELHTSLHGLHVKTDLLHDKADALPEKVAAAAEDAS